MLALAPPCCMARHSMQAALRWRSDSWIPVSRLRDWVELEGVHAEAVGRERERPRFVQLFYDDDFMAFSDGVMSEVEANVRFDRMPVRCCQISLAKQPITERSSRSVVGYTDVERTEFEDHDWPEWGYRLATQARGKGYATEASAALLGVASREFEEEWYAGADGFIRGRSGRLMAWLLPEWTLQERFAGFASRSRPG
jgi:Acetyltransferase (GNAT) domain